MSGLRVEDGRTRRGCFASSELSPKPQTGTADSKAERALSAPCTCPHSIFETVTVILFTIELAIRFIVAPDSWRFLKSFPNIVDALAVLPYYITVGLDQSTSFTFLRSVRLTRIFRVFKFGRYSTGIQMFGGAIFASRQQLVRSPHLAKRYSDAHENTPFAFATRLCRCPLLIAHQIVSLCCYSAFSPSALSLDHARLCWVTAGHSAFPRDDRGGLHGRDRQHL